MDPGHRQQLGQQCLLEQPPDPGTMACPTDNTTTDTDAAAPGDLGDPLSYSPREETRSADGKLSLDIYTPFLPAPEATALFSLLTTHTLWHRVKYKSKRFNNNCNSTPHPPETCEDHAGPTARSRPLTCTPCPPVRAARGLAAPASLVSN